MAENQPAPAPAADPVSPQNPGQQPDPKPADQQPASPQNQPSGPSAPAIELDDEQKNYLKSQGIAEENFGSPEAIAKIVKHNSSLRKELASKSNTPAPSTQPAPTAQPNEGGQPSGPAAQPDSLDTTSSFLIANTLATSLPDFKEDLVSGKFFKDMQDFGIAPVVGGQPNIQGMLKYGNLLQEKRNLEKQLEEIQKPGNIPDAKPNDAPTVADDAPMSKQIAQAILVQDPNHPRAAEAKQFLQENR